MEHMDTTFNRIVKETEIPNEVITLHKFGLISTNDMIEKLEKFRDEHDHKEDGCNCYGIHGLIKAFKEYQKA